MTKEYKKFTPRLGSSVEDAVNVLLSYREKGILVKCEFNQACLYSDTVTMDNAYLAVTGKTKKEYDEMMEEYRNEAREQKKRFEEIKGELSKKYMEEGHDILPEEKHAYWDKIVSLRLDDIYEGMEVEASLEIMKILNSGEDFEVAREKIRNQNHSGGSYALVTAIVSEFCERGPAFVQRLKNGLRA